MKPFTTKELLKLFSESAKKYPSEKGFSMLKELAEVLKKFEEDNKPKGKDKKEPVSKMTDKELDSFIEGIRQQLDLKGVRHLLVGIRPDVSDVKTEDGLTFISCSASKNKDMKMILATITDMLEKGVL